MVSDDKVNILLVDDQPAKLLSYETILAGLGETLPDHFLRMADIMAAVLEGRTPPGSIPVSAAARVELHVNRTLATRLGIEVPGAILVRADRLL